MRGKDPVPSEVKEATLCSEEWISKVRVLIKEYNEFASKLLLKLENNQNR